MANALAHLIPTMPSTLGFSGFKRTLFTLWICILAFTLQVGAAQITVDDADSGVSYVGAWNVGNSCTECLAQPDRTRAHSGTWHDCTRGENDTVRAVEYQFRGTAITVYGIMVNIVRTEYLFTTNVAITLSIDGRQVSTFSRQPVDTESYAYDMAMVSTSGLSDTTHTARIEVQPSSAFLFDYLVYTTADQTTTSSSSTTTTSQSTSSRSLSSTSTSSTSLSTTTSQNSTVSVSISISISTDANGQQHTSAISVPVGDSTSDRSSKGLSTSAIVGISLGVVALLLLILALFLWRRHQERQRFFNGLRDEKGGAGAWGQLNNPESTPGAAGFPHTHQDAAPDPFVLGGGAAQPHDVFAAAAMGGSERGGANSDAYSGVVAPGYQPNHSFTNLQHPTAATPAISTLNSKQLELQQQQALLPAQLGGNHHEYGWARNESDISSHTGIMSSYLDSSNGSVVSAAPLINSATRNDTPEAPWLRNITTPSSADSLYPHGVPAQLITPMPINLSTAQRDHLQQQQQQQQQQPKRRYAPSGMSGDYLDGDETYNSSGRESYVQPPANDGRTTASSNRPPTAPPPYIRSPPPATGHIEMERMGMSRIAEGEKV